MVGGEVGNAISKLCTAWPTKHVWVDSSSEPFVAHWDGEVANEWNIEKKHLQKCSNSKI